MNSITCANVQYPNAEPFENPTFLHQTTEALVTAGKIAILIVVAVKGGLFASAAALILMSAVTAAYKALKERFTLKEGPIKQLPPEILGTIISNLNQRNVLSASMVNSGWKNAALKVAKEEYLNLQIFTNKLVRDLDVSYEFVTHLLINFIKYQNIENSNLLETQFIYKNNFNDVVSFLQFLDGVIIEKYLLAGENEEIFLIAKLLKQFNPSMNREESTQDTFNEACLSIPKLINIGCIDKLINSAEKISDVKLRTSFLEIIQFHLGSVCKSLSKIGKYEDAIALSNSISAVFSKAEALIYISTQLLNAGNKDRALELTRKILEMMSDWKNIASCMITLSTIPTELLFHKDNQGCHLKIAYSVITGNYTSDLIATVQLFDQLSDKNVYDQTEAFRSAALSYMKSGYNLIANRFANQISDKQVRDSVFDKIKVELLEIGNCDEMIELTKNLNFGSNQILWAFYSRYEQVTKIKRLEQKVNLLADQLENSFC